MDRVKNVSRGLPLQEEYEWRCEKLLSYLENEDPLAYANWVNNSIELLEHLSKYKMDANQNVLIVLVKIMAY